MSKLSQWKNRDKPQTIPARTGNPVLALGQRGMLLMHSMSDNPLLYQYGHLYTFQNALDPEEIELKMQQLVQNHSALRSNYSLENDLPKVSIREQAFFELERGNTIAKEFFTRPFDLESDLLIRGMLIGDRTLALSIHHIVGDRQSLDILFKSLFQDSEKSDKPLDYFAFSDWYNKSVNKDEHTRYWQERLKGEIPLLNLPNDYLRPGVSTYQGHSVSTKSTSKLLEDIKAVSKKTLNTKYIIIAAAYKLFLHLYTGQEDILIGTPVVTRSKKELNSVIGYFNETLVLRNKVTKNPSFIEFLSQVNDNFLKDLEHKDVSFDHLVNTIKPPRNSSAHPIFQAMLLYNKHSYHTKDGLQVKSEMIDLGISKFDITLFVEEFNDILEFRLEYSSELFAESTAKRLLDDFLGILSQLVSNPETRPSEIKIPSAYKFVKIQPVFRIMDDSILDLIDFKSANEAVKFEDYSINYKELDHKSDLGAAFLVSEGVKVNDFVGLYCARSVEMIIGILSILKVGGAYIPLDPNYPEERIHYILRDSGADKVLFHKCKIDGDHQNIDLEKALKSNKVLNLPAIKSSQNAYMIYTSGSTGQPKGVPISHENLIISTKARFSFYKEKVNSFLLLSSFSFDSSVAGIFWTLTSGGELVISKERAEQNVDLLSKLIHKEQITHTLLLPSLYNLILKFSETADLRSLKNVMVAGEACTTEVVERHFSKLPACELYNEYGPTEATVWSIAHRITREDMGNQVPIGQSIPHYDNYILNTYEKPQAISVEGEIFISGLGLSMGYWNNEELSKEKFITHPEFGRLYKTGDLAKYDEQGRIYFKGRKDKQIKILGHRVELDEIRNRILKIKEISEVLVIAKNDKIIAFYKGEEAYAIERIDLGLPSYMTPSIYVFLKDFPRLPNGKIDYSQLLEKDFTSQKTSSDLQAPSTENEVILRDIWAEVLGMETLGVDENFFELGGTSLLSIQILSRAKKKGIELSATQIFEFQTIRRLALSAEDSSTTENDILVPFRKSGSELPLFCIHGGGGHVFFYKEFAESLSKKIPVYSFQPKGLDGKAKVAANIEDMAATYVEAMQSVQPKGPYQILGTCFSNSVALEMASQLSTKGEVLAHLFIIDSAPVHLFGNNEGQEKQTMKRFSDMLLRGDFKRIQSKIKSRLFGKKKLEGNLKIAVEEDENLANTILEMNKMYANYDWKPYRGEIEFVRSTEFHQRTDKKYHLQQWNKLALKGVNVSVVEGHHISLFESPEVKNLASKISDLILNS